MSRDRVSVGLGSFDVALVKDEDDAAMGKGDG